MSDKQYLRKVDAGDVAFEGRQSNGFLAKEDGSTILYGAINQQQLETLKNENFNGNVDVDGNVSSVIAFLSANKNLDFPEGNNNLETMNNTVDVKKITQTVLNKSTTGDENDWWIKEILNFEATKGSSSGGGLSNWGYNSRINPGNPPTDITTGKSLTIDDAVEYFKQDILPKVQQYPLGLRERAADFLYNTGRDPRIYYLDQYLKSIGQPGLPNRGSYNVDTKTSAWTVDLQNSLNAEWDKYKNDIDQLSLQQRTELLDKGRDFYYQNINKKPDGSPNDAYFNTWKFRVTDLFQTPPSSQVTTPPVVTPPPVVTSPPVVTPTVTPIVTPSPTEVIEEKIATPAPTDVSTEQEDFLFLSETGIEIDPIEIYYYIDANGKGITLKEANTHDDPPDYVYAESAENLKDIKVGVPSSTSMPMTTPMTTPAPSTPPKVNMKSSAKTKGSGGFPISAYDQKFADKFSGGKFPALLYEDGTMVIREYDKNVKGRVWLKIDPEYEKSLVNVSVPLADGSNGTVRVNPIFKSKLEPAFAEIKRLGLQKYIKSCSGALAVRNNTNAPKNLSFHSWALAIDLNADVYSNGTKFDIVNQKVGSRAWNDFDKGYYEVAKIMNKFGIGWLNSYDPMHFSYGEIKGYGKP